MEESTFEPQNHIKILEDYIYRLEQEVSALTKEVFSLRAKYEPQVANHDHPF